MSNKLVYGIGINDLEYNISLYGFVEGKKKVTWRCPFYMRWNSMLCRCYSGNLHLKHPSYIGCYVCEDWKYFSKFKAWMETQDWEGKQLDKDILVRGNKVYGPYTCVFVDSKVNNFLTERGYNRGEWPIGVTFHKASNKFRASCSCVETGKLKHLGLFDSPEKAHQAWLQYKLEQAYILASKQDNESISKSLIDRYKNYEDTLN